MRAFIVRPFGEKNSIDFERVHQLLIAPALAATGISGDTTAPILEAGNIRTDMFQQLLLADLVVADVSIDNANVFYELGIRHALRSRRTVLIRARGTGAQVPFDLRTDRYLDYDPTDPAAALATLTDALRQTVASERNDSPVYLLLPDLEEPPTARLMPVPAAFVEEAERAHAAGQAGRLGLLGWESEGMSWEGGGIRVVARLLFRLRAFRTAGAAFERLRAVDSLDIEANLRLATIYQKLGDLTTSDQALRRALSGKLSPADRAEALALTGSNQKARLAARLAAATAPADRRAQALQSKYLLDACDAYRSAYLQDLNHYYPGLNALALATVALEIIRRHPSVWIEQFPTVREADDRRDALEDQRSELAASVALSLAAARIANPSDEWLPVSVADHLFLTAKRSEVAAAAYRRALEDATSLVTEAARAQLLFYRSLGIFDDRVEPSLATFPPEPRFTPAAPGWDRAIIFTGHRVDTPGRDQPRFPQPLVPAAAARIRAELERIAAGSPQTAFALAGGASGGDLLFHEACDQLGITSRLRLTLPQGPFLARSVAPSGADWPDRFHAALVRLGPSMQVLAESEQLPAWLVRKPGYTVWGRTNVWLLEEALATGAPEIHLLALWNGEAGDGPGGTADLIRLAQERGGITTHIIRPQDLAETEPRP